MRGREAQLGFELFERRDEMKMNGKTEVQVESMLKDLPSHEVFNELEEEEEQEDSASLAVPFDPTKIRVDDKRLSVDLIIRRLKQNEIDLTPSFQRKAGLWSDEAQSRLIESMMIRIPIPAFYVDVTNEGPWIVVDGVQRLTALRRFAVDRELTLCGLEYLKDLHGLHYDEIPRNMQRRIEETQVTIYTIEPGTPDPAKFNIFNRINTGGMGLSPQEIRNALYRGAGLELTKRLADTPRFIRMLGKAGPRDRMTGSEYILRFLALSMSKPKDYDRTSLDSFLIEQLKKLNRCNESELNEHERRFERALDAAELIFGEFAFRKMYLHDTQKKPVNKALFEAWMVNLDRCTDAQLRILIERNRQVVLGFMHLMEGVEFEKSVSLATRDVKKVNLRLEAIRVLIQDIISN